MSKLNYAIIGTNWLSKHYANAIEEAGEKFYAICSRDKKRAEEFAAGRAKAFDNIEELLKDPEIDVVYNCTPNVHHASISTACLKAGKHVFCEKPITMSPEEYEEVCGVADHSGKKFAEAIMNYFSPAIPALKKEIQQSGDVILARLDYSQRSSKLEAAKKGILASTFQKESGGGVLMDLGVYPLHLAVNLFGAPKSLQASARWFGEVDITDTLVLNYDNFDVVITVSKLGQGFVGSEIICDKSTFQLKNISMVLDVTKTNLDREVSEIDCGAAMQGNVMNDSDLFVHTASLLIREFSDMVRGKGEESYHALRKNSREVQRLMKEAKFQIGY
jgi:scyllo-inositol 2-dehydrogenase (NADP+)